MSTLKANSKLSLHFFLKGPPPLNEFDSKYRFLMYIFVHENMCIKSSNNFINIRYTSFNLHLIYHDSNIVFLIEVKISFKIKHFLFWHLTESATLLNESSTRQVGDYVSNLKANHMMRFFCDKGYISFMEHRIFISQKICFL